MPTFSREEIVHLGDLARIDDVPPTANPVPLEAYLRPDVAETPLTQEEALAGGPKTEAGMFVAPRILGSEE
ncbi:MAG: aspartyl/glutamyl-tRNA amidotransferase subunit C [Bifidobacterium longum]|nr:aspartyl/glutamyl-tRNA amidotransferase subunit C [Bifidobacterium longum]